MKITLQGVKRKCSQCREHFPSAELWPTRNGQLCNGCKRAHSAVETHAGLSPRRTT